jgi:hypothetical protein
MYDGPKNPPVITEEMQKLIDLSLKNMLAHKRTVVSEVSVTTLDASKLFTPANMPTTPFEADVEE